MQNAIHCQICYELFEQENLVKFDKKEWATHKTARYILYPLFNAVVPLNIIWYRVGGIKDWT